MTRPQAVLFDLGNVLVRFRPQAFPERLGLDAISSGIHYGESIRRIVREYELGSMGTSEFLAGLGRMFDRRYTEQQLLDALQSVLDVPIPEVTIPVAPGRNLAILVEAAARNHMLKLQGYDASTAFIERQQHAIKGNA